MLYYTVTHNVSGDGSELAFNTTTNEAILNGARYGEAYFISVCGVNIIGKGKVSTITFTKYGNLQREKALHYYQTAVHVDPAHTTTVVVTKIVLEATPSTSEPSNPGT